MASAVTEWPARHLRVVNFPFSTTEKYWLIFYNYLNLKYKKICLSDDASAPRYK
ncbi:hypothetical protein KF947_19155 [Halomonas sp. FeN2]|uniref:hypothetical protein n=1 Tax=Halomonas sp. FeN2 TaxID=2832500 RepID=UPI001D0B9DAB|nr:hypothetical protein [Halomonas sp. FeN2]UBR49421.1 hypothetical protein KF947_19155 [Halomonas sp. FeN2]